MLTYGYEFNVLLNRVIGRVREQLIKAIENDTLDAYLETHNLTYKEKFPVNVRRHQILILGTPKLKKKEIEAIAEESLILKSQLDLENDYDKLTNYDISSLEYSDKYSDIIIAALPHKMKGIGEYNSAISKMEAEPEKYPHVIVARDGSGEVKLTATIFRKIIVETNLYKALYDTN